MSFLELPIKCWAWNACMDIKLTWDLCFSQFQTRSSPPLTLIPSPPPHPPTSGQICTFDWSLASYSGEFDPKWGQSGLTFDYCQHSQAKGLCGARKYPYLPHGRDFSWFHPPPPPPPTHTHTHTPLWISIKPHTFPLKFLVFEIPRPRNFQSPSFQSHFVESHIL